MNNSTSKVRNAMGKYFSFGLLMALCCGCAGAPSDGSTQSAAYDLAQGSLTAQIKATSTVTFPTWDKARYTQKGDALTVVGFVDVKNSAGATQRNFWAAQLHRGSDGKTWVLDRADFAFPVDNL